MKILFVTDLYPIGKENIAKALFYFVQEWQKQGHEVEVIRSNFIFNTLLRGRKIIKENIYFEQNTKIYNLNFHTPFWFNVYNKLPKDFSLKNYDVIISHMPCGALMSNKLLKKDKIKYICGVHCSDIIVLNDFKYLFFRNALKKAYKNADKIAARSPILQRKIEKIIPEARNKTFIAYSGIEQGEIEQKQQVKYLNKERINFSTVASLIKRKNIDVILKALSILSINFHLTIMGDGKERNNLEKLAKKLNIQDNISFTGRIKREEVIANLKNSDIFILLSNNETFGLTYLEAMSTNNIVIAKKNDGIDGIIKDQENGFLTNANPLELKKCIEKILSLEDTAIAEIKNNTGKTIKELSIENSAKNYIENIH